MNEKEFNGLILAELVKIANDVFTNEIEIAPGTYTAAELAKLKDANGNEINIKYKRRIYKDSEKRIKSGCRFCKRNSQTKQKKRFFTSYYCRR